MSVSLSNVTLIDGRSVRSDSEEWRAECEARAVLRMRSRGVRRGWLLKVEQRRGKENADALYRDVMRLWEHEKKTGYRLATLDAGCGESGYSYSAAIVI